jgi:hypothetical protein
VGIVPVKSRAGTKGLTGGTGLSAEERREREGATDGWGRAISGRERGRGAGAREREECPTERGDFLFFLFLFLFYFLFLKPFSLLTKNHINFLDVQNEILYVKCYKKSWCMHMMNEMFHEMRS